MKFILAFLVLAATAQSSSAQTVTVNTASPAVESARGLWQQITGWITTAAEQMPENEYAFRPAPTVRTFGQLIGHIAGAQNMFCASALGDKQASEDDIEKNVTTKTGLIAALKASTAYCDRAYSQSDAASAQMTSLFGDTHPRIFSLMINATHNGEHYGNIVTYLRVTGRVPPSSQPAPPKQ